MTLNLAGEEGEWRRGGRRELEGEASIKARLRTLGAEALVYLLAVCWQPAVNCREEGRVSSFINLRASEPCEPASHASQRAMRATVRAMQVMRVMQAIFTRIFFSLIGLGLQVVDFSPRNIDLASDYH